MKLTVTQENLNRALNIVGRVASSRTPLPILNNILLRVDNNRLLLAATNLEIAITEHIGAKVDKNGAITIPARLMSEFIGNLPKGNVDLDGEGTKLKITSGNYTSTINGMLPDEFPSLPDITAKDSFSLDAVKVKRAITQTVIVASHDDTRPVLTGVFCHSFKGKLYFAATDGYRLAERDLGAVGQDINAIIPASTMQDVVRVMGDDIKEIEVLFDENQVRIRFADTEITSRLIDGAFPDYRQLIPATSDITFDISHDEFVRITKIASLFARESGGSITIKTDSGTSNVSIHSVASQLGENTSSAEAKVSADGQVTLNSRYVLEALNCIDSDIVTFSFSGKLSPCVLGAADKKADYKHIIMPLKS
jgi:DNA polymerase III subunit beta